MKIVVFETEQWEQDEFQRLSDDHEISFEVDPLSVETADDHRDAEVLSAFIYSDLSADVLEKFENLKMIATRSTGFDHIDAGYCKENGIIVCNVPTYGENTVAEHVFGLLLTISHNLLTAFDRTRKGDFSLKGLQGFDLKGKTLGVIGTGNIGIHVIRMAKGFEMNVIAFDVEQKEELASELGFTYVEMDQLLSDADIITLHVPGSEKTHHLLSDDEFAKMKDGVILINTARGSVIDVQALGRAITDKKVSAAGFDVLPDEPVIREEGELLRSVFREKHDLDTLLADHILLRLRNVYITPHSAFNTREAVQRILDTTMENIEAFAAGDPRNVVIDGNPEGS